MIHSTGVCVCVYTLYLNVVNIIGNFCLFMKQVFPAHGAGSPCGKNLSSDLYSTIGKEKLTNPALSYTDVSYTAYNTILTCGNYVNESLYTGFLMPQYCVYNYVSFTTHLVYIHVV